MSDPQSSIFHAAITAALAGITGFVGMIVGVKVQGAEIANLKDRMDREGEQNREWLQRIDEKVDRLIERLL